MRVQATRRRRRAVWFSWLIRSTRIARTLDGLRAALTNNSLAAEPDDLAQIKDLAEEITVLDKEMDDLVRATSAAMQAGSRR